MFLIPHFFFFSPFQTKIYVIGCYIFKRGKFLQNSQFSGEFEKEIDNFFLD